jgi:hypothetical protein
VVGDNDENDDNVYDHGDYGNDDDKDVGVDGQMTMVSWTLMSMMMNDDE